MKWKSPFTTWAPAGPNNLQPYYPNRKTQSSSWLSLIGLAEVVKPEPQELLGTGRAGADQIEALDTEPLRLV